MFLGCIAGAGDVMVGEDFDGLGDCVPEDMLKMCWAELVKMEGGNVAMLKDPGGHSRGR